MLRGATELHAGPAGGTRWIPPAVEPVFHILADTRPDMPIVQARQELRQPPLMHPGREQGAQGGGTSRIGIHIAGDVETARIRLIQQFEQSWRLVPVLPA